MAQGRCPGCGAVDTLKASNAHIGRCPEYAQRFLAGEDLPSPAEAFRRWSVERKPAPAPRAPRMARPEVSDSPARVAPPPKPERTGRVPQPVYVEYWDTPQYL